MVAVDIGDDEGEDAAIGAYDSAGLELALLRAVVLAEVLEDLEGVALLVEVVDANDSGGCAHVGGAQAAEVLEALPPVDQPVRALALRLQAPLTVVLREPRVVAETHVREEALLEGRLSLDGLEAAPGLALQPAALVQRDG